MWGIQNPGYPIALSAQYISSSTVHLPSVSLRSISSLSSIIIYYRMKQDKETQESEAMAGGAGLPWDDSVELEKSEREADYVAFLQWMDAELARGIAV